MDQASAKRAQEKLDVVHEISKLLDCDLDKRTLAIMMALLENDVNPSALAAVVTELKREAAVQAPGTVPR